MRDTTMPEAMARTLQAVVLGEVLTPASGANGCRAGCWAAAPATSACARACRPAGVSAKKPHRPANEYDIGVLWPPGRAPVVLACYLTGSTADGARRDAALAAVGRSVAHWVAA
ncbi:MAG: hypothetical protein U1E74_04135 [Paenacidovorax caeni]